MLRFSCPKCQTSLQFDDSVRGTVVACDSCGQKVRVPELKTKAKAVPPLPVAQAVTPNPPAVPSSPAGIPPQPPPLPAQEPEDWPDLEPEPYRADGGMAPAGSLIVLGVCLVVSVLLGALASFISQWFYLILIFPVAIGFGVGFAGWLGVHLGKVRAPWWAGLVGFLAGCFAMVTVQYVDYLRERDLIPIPDLGFVEFVDIKATIGVSIGRARNPNQRGINLGYVGSYIYWVVEMLIVAGIAFAVMLFKAQDPFCTACGRWKMNQFLGYLDAEPYGAKLAVEEGNLHYLEHHQVTDSSEGNFKVQAAVCPECESENPFELQIFEANKKQQNQFQSWPFAQATYPGYGLPVVEEVFQQRRVSSDQ